MTTPQQTLLRARLQDAVVQPWKNGQGLTRELLAWRDQDSARGPGAPDWAVRVSVAEISQDGPFSPYPGVDRGFAVLAGAGVRLTLDGHTRLLAPGDTPLCFLGESAPQCALLAGPTQDLNLMVRRSSGRLGFKRAAAGDELAGVHRWRAVYAVTSVVLTIEALEWPVEAHTLCWQPAPESPWRLKAGDAAYWLFME